MRFNGGEYTILGFGLLCLILACVVFTHTIWGRYYASAWHQRHVGAIVISFVGLAFTAIGLIVSVIPNAMANYNTVTARHALRTEGYAYRSFNVDAKTVQIVVGDCVVDFGMHKEHTASDYRPTLDKAGGGYIFLSPAAISHLSEGCISS